MRRDLVSAYAVTAARVGSWVIVSAVVFRKLGAEALGILTLVRATIGILSYTSFGLGPALVKMLADASSPRTTAQQSTAIPVAALAVDDVAQSKRLLAYSQGADAPPSEGLARVYGTGERLAVGLGMVGLVLAGAYALSFRELHGVTRMINETGRALVVTFGVGIVCRMISEAPSALLQARGRIASDNALVTASEIAWGISTALLIGLGDLGVAWAGLTFLGSNLLLLAARGIAGRMEAKSLTTALAPMDRDVARHLLATGSLIALAQVADFLYAPTDCILINQFLGAEFVAYYSPAIQIDAGLLLLVGGLSMVLYPRAAIAHAAGNVERVRTYYRRGTMASFALLLAAAVAVWALSPWIFRLWFASDMPQTRAILPLMLIHSVIGGSSAVGRSVLLAVGKTKQFTAAVLIAGLLNVIVSFILVRYAGMGLKGIVVGTIVAVVLRCAVWMPWYVNRTLKELEEGKRHETRGKSEPNIG